MTFITDIVSSYVHQACVSEIKQMAMLSARVEGAVSLAWGLPSFRTPDYIRNGVIKRLSEDPDAGKYTLPDGLPEFRDLVVQKHLAETGINVSADSNVMITAGNMQGLNTMFHTMLDPGDEIILTDPCFASHIQQIILFNGKAVYWPLDESNNWSLDIDRLPALITDKTQAIVLVTPSNPTGKIFTEQELVQVGEIARQHDILVIIDDPYSSFTYENGNKYFNLASVERYKDHVVYLHSFSKAYAMSGWRLGYMIMPEELKREAMKVHDATMICAPRISQLAGIAALSQPSIHKQEFEAILKQRRSLMVERLSNVPHLFSWQKPEGAYYMFPKILVDHTDSKSFAIDLLYNAKVTVTPGSAFGPSGESHVRMAYCVDEDTINIAFDRIENYFSGK
ncbi:pyridoxal phosphate-dependent aminotransferase [Photobacterium sp.]|uniref:pyridoxal phosphate-dependent aminotransferase n=1 Tax=Photobacterium sp. TaxID=660 RepID=UPI00299D31DB|nr:pyridoxal phosphate-dependent aminotransferase [Photobacterium sp.]MDX1300776.1 pyridoxal phosphate-dependent aminotransferase [Photobacterium sp.]